MANIGPGLSSETKKKREPQTDALDGGYSA